MTRVAVFRPADERIERASELLESLGVEPVADPMLAIEPTGAIPRVDADYTVLTSKTGVEIVADAGWQPDGELCAIGTATADALRAAGYRVDRVPEEFSSAGLVTHLTEDVRSEERRVGKSV